MMMTVQDRINEVVELVRGSLSDAIPSGDRDLVVASVKDLGYRWQEANAHETALCICAGAMNNKEEEFDFEDKELLKKLEAEGSDILLKVFGLPVYSALVMQLLSERIGADDDEEDEDE